LWQGEAGLWQDLDTPSNIVAKSRGHIDIQRRNWSYDSWDRLRRDAGVVQSNFISWTEMKLPCLRLLQFCLRVFVLLFPNKYNPFICCPTRANGAIGAMGLGLRTFSKFSYRRSKSFFYLAAFYESPSPIAPFAPLLYFFLYLYSLKKDKK